MLVYIGKYPNRRYKSWFLGWLKRLIPNRIVYVHIHEQDIWNMDNTLAHIISPMLKKLKEHKHGSPVVDIEDVPENLRGDSEDSVHERWEWVLDEMIWAFEEYTKDWELQYYEGTDIQFEDGKIVNKGPKQPDREGMKNHGKRIQNGVRLFGKYYSGLWD